LSELVTLRIEATTGHVGLARATATALAARLDFTYDRLMDLHIALDEVCGRVLATSDPPATSLELGFEPDEAGLTVTVTSDGALKPGGPFLNPWSQMILGAIAEDLEVTESSGEPVRVRFRVRREA